MIPETAQVTVDGAVMRARNSSLLLNLIWREEKISRADIARRTGLSPSTVSAIVTKLQQTGLVGDLGTGESRGGRRPTLLGFYDDAFSIVGVQLGATHITAVLTNLRGQVRVARHEACPARSEPETALRVMVALIRDVLECAGTPLERLVGIGVGVPSPVHPNSPGRMAPIILPAWQDVDLSVEIRKAFPVPVFVDNDANVGALAERWWGAGTDGQDLTYIKMGTGVGSGHIMNGQLYRGARGTAGEIGHVAIDPSGPTCVCGLQGCLTTFVGTPSVLQQAKALGLAPSAGPTLTLNDVIAAFEGGHTAAHQVIAEVGHHLGIAVAGLLNLLNPAIVVLGGQITSVGDGLLAPLRASVKARALSTSVAETEIVTSKLGEHAIPVGAATLVLQAALRDQRLFSLPQASTQARGQT